jgi:hypothetical protein
MVSRTCLAGYSRWISKEAFRATGIDLAALANSPSTEMRSRQSFFLTASDQE